SHLWAKGLENPLYGIAVEINAADLMALGKEGKTVKFTHNGVEYISFKAQDLTKYMNEDKLSLSLEIVGKTSINKWKDNITPQIIVDAFKIAEVKETKNDWGGWF